ncbi:hypothetical protein HY086_04175 [Candidatus Gottesmanbacteria bacterium]|nr:hypothetical protein [Candidatus Gottesmanbacteria bacterium]
MKKIFLMIALLAILSVSACVGYNPPPLTSTGGATQVTDLGFKIPKNAAGNTAEQQNIIDRLKVTTDPTKVLWIQMISLDGKIIQRMPVAHKITSSGKRLEPVTAASRSQYGVDYPEFKGADGRIYQTSEFIQPDGTFGSSDPYVFWFDPQHRYHQWGTAGGLGYLLTDYPVDLRNPQDLITGMFNADKASFEWQKLQEAQLCKQEGKTYDTVKGECK